MILTLTPARNLYCDHDSRSRLIEASFRSFEGFMDFNIVASTKVPSVSAASALFGKSPAGRSKTITSANTTMDNHSTGFFAPSKKRSVSELFL